MSLQTELATDVVQLALDLIGIVDPSGVADGMNALISLGRGQWVDAVISGVSVLPYLGDLAKLGKLPRQVDSLLKAIQLAARDERFAARMRPALKQLEKVLEKLPLHKFPETARRELQRAKAAVEGFLRGAAAVWKEQLRRPDLRRFNPEYHGARALRPGKTALTLKEEEAARILRDAIHDVAETGAGKAPSLWGWRDRKVYRFMWDNQSRWHGYPTLEKPPTDILRRWLQKGTIDKKTYHKLLHSTHRVR